MEVGHLTHSSLMTMETRVVTISSINYIIGLTYTTKITISMIGPSPDAW